MPLSYDLGTAHPRHRGHLVGHAATRAHSLAVTSFFGVEPTIMLARHTLTDSLPCGVPTPNDWWMALVASKKGMSARCYSAASKADIAPEEGENCSLSALGCGDHNELPKMLFAYKEVIMDRFREQVSRAIDLSLTSDAKKPVVEWRFCCCDDNLDVYHGLLDLQLPTPSPAINEDTPPSHETAHMQMPNFIDNRSCFQECCNELLLDSCWLPTGGHLPIQCWSDAQHNELLLYRWGTRGPAGCPTCSWLFARRQTPACRPGLVA